MQVVMYIVLPIYSIYLLAIMLYILYTTYILPVYYTTFAVPVQIHRQPIHCTHTKYYDSAAVISYLDVPAIVHSLYSMCNPPTHRNRQREGDTLNTLHILQIP